MKVAVVLFHKNVDRYPAKWIETCIASIRWQTYQDFEVFELDYGGTKRQIYEGSTMVTATGIDNHADALNFLLKMVFELDYECAFNINVDDFYHPQRFQKQLAYIQKGYDIVSSNFNVVDCEGNILFNKTFDYLDMQKEAAENHNIIAHPVVCYSKRFSEQLVASEIPRDDFELWKRCYASGKYKFIILPEYLLNYRVHEQKVS
jgi:hydrogenase maturation factor HypF (carbamoyltransferase family)